MPFTFSHPAIILPFLHKRLKVFSSTGLIVGSIAPDFESFITLSEKKIYSHTWTGMFWYDLPMALVICFAFHLIIRDPLIENLPTPLQQKFIQYLHFNWGGYFKQHFLMIIVSLLIGIASHLLWDSLTHLNIHDPDAITSTLMFGKYRLYIVLQYGCSLLGMMVIIWAIYRLPGRNATYDAPAKFKYWLYLTLVAVLIAALLYTFVYDETEMILQHKSTVIIFIYIIITSILSSLLIVSFIYRFYFKNTSRLTT
jgi:hypothetical protein